MSSAAPKATNSFLTINILIVHNFYKPLYSSVMDIKIFPKLNTRVLWCINTEITVKYLVNLIGNPDVSNLLCKI